MINTTTSIFSSARAEVSQAVHAVENLIHAGVDHVEDEAKSIEHHAEDEAQSIEQHVEAVAAKEASRIVAALHVAAISAGTDIQITFDHAGGEVKRIVINGATTLEDLIDRLRSLA